MSPSQLSSLLNSLPCVLEASWPQANETLVLAPFTYTTSKPGKEIRKLLIDAFNVWLAVPREQLQVIERVIQILHSASLMVDDIEDAGELRRGQPAAHMIYGIPQTINSANYAYFLAYKEAAKLRSLGGAAKDFDLVVTDELLNVHRGQGLEILWRDLLHCPTEEEYISMVNNKTSACFRMAVRLMMMCAAKNADVDFISLVNIFGVYFQIRDDYMNLQATEYVQNKGFADDLTEGKFSFPIVHGIHADDADPFLTSALHKRSSTLTLKHLIIEHLRTKTKSFDYTLTVMQGLECQVQEKIARLGGNPILEKIMDALHVESDQIGVTIVNGAGDGGCTKVDESKVKRSLNRSVTEV